VKKNMRRSINSEDLESLISTDREVEEGRDCPQETVISAADATHRNRRSLAPF
jgi:hypothetical protein